MRVTRAQYRAMTGEAPPKKRVKIPRGPSPLEAEFDLQFFAKTEGPREWYRSIIVKEYVFKRTRRWRFDRAVPAVKVAVELEGVRGEDGHEGGHRSIEGFTKDCRKYNAASEIGWIVLRATGAIIPEVVEQFVAILDRKLA